MTAPLVTVVMGVRDGLPLVDDAINSVVAQTFTAWEMVVVDDGSADGTAEAVRCWARNDPRVRLITQPASGLVAALNRGCAEACGSFIARMDADDVCFPTRFALQVERLQAEPGLGVVGGQILCSDLAGTITWPGTYPLDDAALRANLAVANPFAHPAVMMRRDVIIAAGGYRDVCLYAEDYDLWVRVLALAQGANVPQTVLRYRVHPGQTAFRDWRQHCVSTLAVQAAARAQQRGEPDPLAGRRGVSEQTLVEMGVTKRQSRTVVAGSLVSLSNLAGRMGDEEQRQKLLRAAEGVAATGSVARDAVARIRLAQALQDLRDGRRVRAIYRLTGSGVRAPVTLAKHAVRLARGRRDGVSDAALRSTA